MTFGSAPEVADVHGPLVGLDVIGPHNLKTGGLQAEAHKTDPGEELGDGRHPVDDRHRDQPWHTATVENAEPAPLDIQQPRSMCRRGPGDGRQVIIHNMIMTVIMLC